MKLELPHIYKLYIAKAYMEGLSLHLSSKALYY